MDKARGTFPIAVSFSNGEQPTAQKLNSVSKQSRAGLSIIERIVGDVWNQSGDSVTSDYPNKITNIARLIGDSNLASVQMPLPDFTGVSNIRIIQDIRTFGMGQSHIKLDYIPINDSTLETSVQSLINVSSLNYTGTSVSRSSITSDLLWNIDTGDGLLTLGSALHESTPQEIEYNVSPASFTAAMDSMNTAGLNVIPHPDQIDWKGLKIVQISTNKYWLVLPFRRPIDISPESKLPIDDNYALIGSPTVYRYYGPLTTGYAITSGISNVNFYRLLPSEIIQNMFISPTAGQVIPEGLIHLWDNSTDTLVEGLTFRVPENPIGAPLSSGQVPWILQVEGLSLDGLFSGYTSSQVLETSAHYQSRFSLLTVGQSLAESIFKIKEILLENNTNIGPTKRLDHKHFTGGQPAQQTRRAFIEIGSIMQ